MKRAIQFSRQKVQYFFFYNMFKYLHAHNDLCFYFSSFLCLLCCYAVSFKPLSTVKHQVCSREDIS